MWIGKGTELHWGGTPHMNMCLDVGNRMGTSHMNCVYFTKVGTLQIKMCLDVHTMVRTTDSDYHTKIGIPHVKCLEIS